MTPRQSARAGDVARRESAVLLDALDSGDWRIRAAAVEEIAARDDEGVTAELVRLLSSENVGERNAAITSLIKRGSLSIDALHGALESNDPDVRNFVALALGHIGDVRSADVLHMALAIERDENVRYMIVEALGRIGHPASAPHLIALLDAEEPSIAAAAAEACGEAQLYEATEALLEMLHDPILGQVAADALGKISMPAALLPLVRFTNAHNKPATLVNALTGAVARTAAALVRSHPALARILSAHAGIPDDSPIVDATVRQLVAGRAPDDWVLLGCWLSLPRVTVELVRYAINPELRQHVASAVRAVEAGDVLARAAESSDDAGMREGAALLAGDDPALDAPWLERLLDDAAPRVRAAAASAVLSHCGHVTVDLVTEALTDEDTDVRHAAARALADAPELPGDLVRALADDDRALVRAIAVHMLEGRCDQALDAAIVKALAEDADECVRAAVAGYLTWRLPGCEWKLVERLSRDASPAVRRHAVHAVVRFRSPEASLILSSMLSDADASVRAAAATAVGFAHGDRPKSLLPGLLGDVPEVVVAALASLARQGLWTATDAVARCVENSDPSVRVAALKALDVLEHQAAVSTAIRLVRTDEAASVRAAAAEVLGGLRGSVSRQAAIAALDDESLIVRAAAVRALPRIMGAAAASYLGRLLGDRGVHGSVVEALVGIGEASVDAVERAVVAHPLKTAGPATYVLASIAGTHADAVLERLLWHKSVGVRWQVAAGLIERPRPALVYSLNEAYAAETDDDVRGMLSVATVMAKR